MPFGYNVSPIQLPSITASSATGGGNRYSQNSVYVDADGDGFYDRDTSGTEIGVENSGKTYIGATAFVSGWGITSPKGGASPVLKAAQLKVNSWCYRFWMLLVGLLLVYSQILHEVIFIHHCVAACIKT